MAKLRQLRAGHMLLAGAIIAGSAVVQAQTPPTTLVGVVRDSSGNPVSGVEVWIRGSDLYTHTGENGGFRLPGAPAGAARVTVRRMGFESSTFDLQLRSGQVDSLIVSLTMIPTALAAVNVEEERMTRSKRLLSGFWERRSRGFGHYLTRAEIESKDPHDFTDVVRMTPGVSVVTVGGRRSIRFSRGSGIRGDCPPQYWVDGMRVENASPDEFPPSDLEALELYAGASTIPAQFAPRSFTIGQRTCGAIVIWTRLPGS